MVSPAIPEVPEEAPAAVPEPVVEPVAEPEPAPAPAPVSISQQLRNAVAGLTTSATSLETAKGGKVDAEADLAVAMDTAMVADTDLRTARATFTAGCDGLIRVVTVLRDEA